MNHGKTVCRSCKKVISQCRCMEGHKNIVYETCHECSLKEDRKFVKSQSERFILSWGKNNEITN